MDFWTAQLSALRHEAPVVPAPEMTGRVYSEGISETWLARRALKAARKKKPEPSKPKAAEKKPCFLKVRKDLPREWPPLKYADGRPPITGKELRMMRLLRHITINELARTCWRSYSSARSQISKFERGAGLKRVRRDCIAAAVRVLEGLPAYDEPDSLGRSIRESDRISREKACEMFKTRIGLGLSIYQVRRLGGFGDKTVRMIERGELVKPATVKRLEDFYKQYERRNI